jgi:3'-phosphoadenosine 5'-phosphosulfate sulfotransferase (PAPS reductase)/FAD synthetase
MTRTPSLWESELPAQNVEASSFPIETSPEVRDLLAAHAPVALGVSGGKDSSATALATTTYLDEMGHRGPRLLIHSDLGRVEWRESLPMCQRLADFLGLELVVVRRLAGDLLDRWQVRWRTNVERYANLETVRLILPWSTPSMLFCRSELKAAIICRELIQRFPGQVILSATGIRREESATRAHAPIAVQQPRLTNATHRTSGFDWHPIVSWSLAQVLAYHQIRQFPLHPAYARGMTRVSCAYCVLASLADLTTSATSPNNQELYRELVEMEIRSSFSFQSGQWLGDVAPWLLTEAQQRGLAEAKRRAAIRERAEARIPRHLLYVKGWPVVIPTREEARVLAEIRGTVADALDISIAYRDPDTILARYAALMQASQNKGRHEAVMRQPQVWESEVTAWNA